MSPCRCRCLPPMASASRDTCDSPPALRHCCRRSQSVLPPAYHALHVFASASPTFLYHLAAIRLREFPGILDAQIPPIDPIIFAVILIGPAPSEHLQPFHQERIAGIRLHTQLENRGIERREPPPPAIISLCEFLQRAHMIELRRINAALLRLLRSITERIHFQ